MVILAHPLCASLQMRASFRFCVVRRRLGYAILPKVRSLEDKIDMATFLELENTTAPLNTVTTPISGTQTFSFVEDGVTFTLSLQGGVGTATLYHNPTDFFDISVASGHVGNLTATLLMFDGSGNPLSLTGTVGLGFSTINKATISALGPSPMGFNDAFSGIATTQTGYTLTGIRFTVQPGGVASLEDLFGTLACFCSGTAISTPDGPRAVEALAVGDSVTLADGRTSRVRWVGESLVDPSLCTMANPVRISVGALGNGIPVRDLYVSADHGIALNGCLINAGALVNGKSIQRERRAQPFNYYHIETDGHDLLLAEGVAAESYLEHLAPQSFGNDNVRAKRVVQEMDLPRITSARLVPASIYEVEPA